MANVTVKINRQAIRQILRSDRVLADLTRRADAVAAATSTGDLTYEVRSDIGRARARAAVIASGARTNAHEHAHHDLARTIDHARR